MTWNTSEKCLACGAQGDRMYNPIWTGSCSTCDREMCDQCGDAEADVDGNMLTCATCSVKQDATDVKWTPSAAFDHVTISGEETMRIGIEVRDDEIAGLLGELVRLEVQRVPDGDPVIVIVREAVTA